MGDRLNRRERQFIKGDTHEDRFDSVDSVLRRMARHMNKKVEIVLPPLPISGFTSEVPESGELMKFMFPMEGTVSRIVFSIDEMSVPKKVEKLAQINIEFTSKGVTTNHMFKFRQGLNKADVNVPILVGDKVSVHGLKGDDIAIPTIKGIWFSLLVNIKQEDTTIKSMVLDSIDKDEAANIAAVTTSEEA